MCCAQFTGFTGCCTRCKCQAKDPGSYFGIGEPKGRACDGARRPALVAPLVSNAAVPPTLRVSSIIRSLARDDIAGDQLSWATLAENLRHVWLSSCRRGCEQVQHKLCVTASRAGPWSGTRRAETRAVNGSEQHAMTIRETVEVPSAGVGHDERSITRHGLPTDSSR